LAGRLVGSYRWTTTRQSALMVNKIGDQIFVLLGGFLRLVNHAKEIKGLLRRSAPGLL
jgi:hypothetical protein